MSDEALEAIRGEARRSLREGRPYPFAQAMIDDPAHFLAVPVRGVASEPPVSREDERRALIQGIARAFAPSMQSYVAEQLEAHEAKIGRQIAPVIRGYLVEQLEPLQREINALRTDVMPLQRDIEQRKLMRHIWSPALEVKGVNEERREFEGVASDIADDLEFDSLRPDGAVFSTPLPLCWQHDVRSGPVGQVVWAKANSKNIEFRARIPLVTEEGLVKQATERAWHSVKYRLCSSVSVGFIPRESEPHPNGKGMIHKSWLWTELSLVTSPAQPLARITAIRAMDDDVRGELDALREEMQSLRGMIEAKSLAEPEAGVALAELAALRAEVSALREKGGGLHYVGVWAPDVRYETNNVCTWDGSMWVAERATFAQKPGDGDTGWRLAVKRGAQGASAWEVAKKHGFRGTETEWLKSLRGGVSAQPSGAAKART